MNTVTEYFTGLASVYAEHRPTYPDAAIAWILHGLPTPVRAADIGCGTGISTRLLAQHGVHVIGIDPNQDMLQQAQTQSRDDVRITYATGRSEATGLPESSVDLVLCAQAFHWFDAMSALREFHRILKAGGRLALMWNHKMPTNAFSTVFCEISEAAQRDAETRGLRVPPDRDADVTVGDYFNQVQMRTFPNPQRLNLEGVLGRMRSASYFPKAGGLREQFEQTLIESFKREQRDGVVVLEHETEVTIATRATRVDRTNADE